MSGKGFRNALTPNTTFNESNARVIGLIKRQSWKLEFHCYHVLYFKRETDSMMNAEKAFCKGTFKITGECGYHKDEVVGGPNNSISLRLCSEALIKH